MARPSKRIRLDARLVAAAKPSKHPMGVRRIDQPAERPRADANVVNARHRERQLDRYLRPATRRQREIDGGRHIRPDLDERQRPYIGFEHPIADSLIDHR